MSQRIAEIIANVSYKEGWIFRCGLVADGPAIYLQVELPYDPDGNRDSVAAAIHRQLHRWKSRKWLLSEHMTEGEVVQTCVLAIMQAKEHEVRESFKYKSKAIFGRPHLSMDRLLEIADVTDTREPAPPCQFCGRTGHGPEFHDTEILNWLSNDPASGTSNGRCYYAYKRRERADRYPGLRADVWRMMHEPIHRW